MEHGFLGFAIKRRQPTLKVFKTTFWHIFELAQMPLYSNDV